MIRTLSKIAIVAGDPVLADRVAAHFRRPLEYVAVFDPPRTRLQQYGHFDNDCIRITNAIRTQRSEAIIFVACAAEIVTGIRSHLPKGLRVIELEEYDQADFHHLSGFRPHPLEVQVSKETAVANDVIAVEDGNPIGLLIAKNLASALGASLLLMPHVSDRAWKDNVRLLRKWANDNDALERENARASLFETIVAQVGPLLKSNPRTITFFTSGTPYGIYPFDCPTTHLFTYPLLGVVLFLGIAKSLNDALRCPTCILVDPKCKGLDTTEFGSLRETFLAAGYMLRKAEGPRATAQRVRYLTEFLPCDFLFYSSHGGEVVGRRITAEFAMPDGNPHEIIYHSVISVMPVPESDDVELREQIIPLSLDGVKWSDDEGKKKIKAGKAFEHFLALNRKRVEDPEAVRIKAAEDSTAVEFSDSLGMNDMCYDAQVENVGGHYAPIVFNNSCSSWRELSARFGFSGASIYIGTSLDIANSVAVEIASLFAREVVNGKNLGFALFRAQRKLQLGYTPYLMHGYIYTSLKKPQHKPPSVLVTKILTEEIALYEARDSDSERQREARNAIRSFLTEELHELVSS